jgi:hypothetical protein
MVRLFGRSNGRGRQPRGGIDNNDNSNNKLRLSPTGALHNDGVISTSSIGNINRHSKRKASMSSPMYEYALDEYAHAVAPGTSNDDGRLVMSNASLSNTVTLSSPTNQGTMLQASELSDVPSTAGSLSRSAYGGSGNENVRLDPCENDVEDGLAIGTNNEQSSHHFQQQQNHSHGLHMSASSTSFVDPVCATEPSIRKKRQSLDVRDYNDNDNDNNNIRSTFERDRPDATYEETYGPAYIGGTIKYIYPTGYQSMRPRSCPWKLSIVICLIFTWLSIFIVGHCSDQADESAAAAAASSVIDDDELVMEIRWCGSRLLYMMWATSMIVTGISAAYCSVIGYIKVRDFAVANSRSQPPGIADAKSDYYVRIRDYQVIEDVPSGGSVLLRRNDSSIFQPTIYQSDGTPQFWGSHIYRPTQAAVAVTSR